MKLLILYAIMNAEETTETHGNIFT